MANQPINCVGYQLNEQSGRHLVAVNIKGERASKDQLVSRFKDIHARLSSAVEKKTGGLATLVMNIASGKEYEHMGLWFRFQPNSAPPITVRKTAKWFAQEVEELLGGESFVTPIRQP